MPVHRPTEVTENLRCDFTPEQKLFLGKELADAHIRLSELDDEEAVIKAQMKSKRANAEAAIGQFSRELSAGFTMKDVKCDVKYDDPNPNEVSYYRRDTGALVRTRPLTAAERQADLPLDNSGTVAVEAVSAEDSAKNVETFFGNEAETKPPEEGTPSPAETSAEMIADPPDPPEEVDNRTDEDEVGATPAPDPGIECHACSESAGRLVRHPGPECERTQV